MTEPEDTCCKVGEAIARYDLDERANEQETFNDRLIARWKGDGVGTAQGYRPLTEWFNKQLLKREYDRTGIEAAGTRIDRDYEALGDETLESEEVRDSLRSRGVDVERVEGSFVSWSTMQRHLKDCLGAEKEPQRARTNWERNSIEFARDQLESKVDDALSSLDSKGELQRASDAEVSITVELSCPECPLRVPLEQALERGYICEDHAS